MLLAYQIAWDGVNQYKFRYNVRTDDYAVEHKLYRASSLTGTPIFKSANRAEALAVFNQKVSGLNPE